MTRRLGSQIAHTVSGISVWRIESSSYDDVSGSRGCFETPSTSSVIGCARRIAFMKLICQTEIPIELSLVAIHVDGLETNLPVLGCWDRFAKQFKGQLTSQEDINNSLRKCSCGSLHFVLRNK